MYLPSGSPSAQGPGQPLLMKRCSVGAPFSIGPLAGGVRVGRWGGMTVLWGGGGRQSATLGSRVCTQKFCFHIATEEGKGSLQQKSSSAFLATWRSLCRGSGRVQHRPAAPNKNPDLNFALGHCCVGKGHASIHPLPPHPMCWESWERLGGCGGLKSHTPGTSMGHNHPIGCAYIHIHIYSYMYMHTHVWQPHTSGPPVGGGPLV